MENDYHVMLVCEGNHVVRDDFTDEKAALAYGKHCDSDGMLLHFSCPHCKQPFRGRKKGEKGTEMQDNPAFCRDCGKKLPWYKPRPPPFAGVVG